jgi:hypothetical protein
MDRREPVLLVRRDCFSRFCRKSYYNFQKRRWIPTGVYPRKSGGRNDIEGQGRQVKIRDCFVTSFLAMTDKPLFVRVLDPLQECPLNACRVSFFASQFSKKVIYDPCFWPIFASPKSRNPYK